MHIILAGFLVILKTIFYPSQFSYVIAGLSFSRLIFTIPFLLSSPVALFSFLLLWPFSPFFSCDPLPLPPGAMIGH